MAWKAIARSATGTSHHKQQLPCQDYSDYQILNEVIIGSVADGAGSAKHAQVGAKLAVKTVLEYLTGVEQWLQKRQKFEELIAKPPTEAEARKLFVKTVSKVVTALQAQAIEGGYSVDDLACTLLVLVATPNWVIAMQIGDGFITLRCQEEDLQLLFSPDKGEYLNETTFVTSADALAAMQVCVRSGKPDFICAATDGLERVAIRMSDWTPFPPFFQPLEEYLRETKHPEQEDEYPMTFLNSDRLNARTDDDKTLFLCCDDRCLDSR